MAIRDKGSVRALALVGPTSAGKTALLEALLEAATGQAVRPGEVGDSSPEARARGHSVELNLAGFDFMGDRYVVVDCPGSLEFCAEIDPALPAVDLAIVWWARQGLALRDYDGALALERFLWLNVGLDVGYVGVGVTLAWAGWVLGRRLGAVGAGLGVVTQGLALLVLEHPVLRALRVVVLSALHRPQEEEPGDEAEEEREGDEEAERHGTEVA